MRLRFAFSYDLISSFPGHLPSRCIFPIPSQLLSADGGRPTVRDILLLVQDRLFGDAPLHLRMYLLDRGKADLPLVTVNDGFYLLPESHVDEALENDDFVVVDGCLLLDEIPTENREADLKEKSIQAVDSYQDMVEDIEEMIGNIRQKSRSAPSYAQAYDEDSPSSDSGQDRSSRRMEEARAAEKRRWADEKQNGVAKRFREDNDNGQDTRSHEQSDSDSSASDSSDYDTSSSDSSDSDTSSSDSVDNDASSSESSRSGDSSSDGVSSDDDGPEEITFKKPMIQPVTNGAPSPAGQISGPVPKLVASVPPATPAPTLPPRKNKTRKNKKRNRKQQNNNNKQQLFLNDVLTNINLGNVTAHRSAAPYFGGETFVANDLLLLSGGDDDVAARATQLPANDPRIQSYHYDWNSIVELNESIWNAGTQVVEQQQWPVDPHHHQQQQQQQEAKEAVEHAAATAGTVAQQLVDTEQEGAEPASSQSTSPHVDENNVSPSSSTIYDFTPHGTPADSSAMRDAIAVPVSLVTSHKKHRLKERHRKRNQRQQPPGQPQKGHIRFEDADDDGAYGGDVSVSPPMMASQSSAAFPSSPSLKPCTAAVLPIDHAQLPAYKTLPHISDVIAYKILEMDMETITPRVSGSKVAEILKYDAILNRVTLRVREQQPPHEQQGDRTAAAAVGDGEQQRETLSAHRRRKRPRELLTAGIQLEEEQQQEQQKKNDSELVVVEHDWRELMDVRCMK